MTEPIVQGWCPGAYKPMMSGDGLVVRIRPVAAEVSRAQAEGIAEAAKAFGNGFIDLTNRANLQIRGVSDDSYSGLMQALDKLDLLDDDPALEPKRNIVLTPFFKTGDLSHRLYNALLSALAEFPSFPGKFGFAIDCGPDRVLTDVPADIRFETTSAGDVIVRAEGSETGLKVHESSAIPAALQLAEWFMSNRPEDIRRMPKLLTAIALPPNFQGDTPAAASQHTGPGLLNGGIELAAPYGQLAADDLLALIDATNVTRLRVTPWRSLWLENLTEFPKTSLITSPDDPRSKIDACAGMPFCPQASVVTRSLADKLAGKWEGSLHVAGCAKGCTHPSTADVVLVGRNGLFDLVRHGTAWEEPIQTGLTPDEIFELDLT